MSAENALASPTLTAPVPRTTTALRFLLPITAPAPPRPALWYWSVERQANGTRFSPAGPVESTLWNGPICSRTSCSSGRRLEAPEPAGGGQELDLVVLDQHEDGLGRARR